MSPERLLWRARQCFRYAKQVAEAEQVKFLLELGHELEAAARDQQPSFEPVYARRVAKSVSLAVVPDRKSAETREPAV